MTVSETPLKDCIILKPDIFRDERGYFFEVFNQEKFEKLTGLNGNFVQDNQSCSGFGVIRGLHFQKGAFSQAKLIQVISGKAFDVAVDLRTDSPTYKKWFGIELNTVNNLQLYIPRGFAHGFSALEENTVVSYKCDCLFDKDSEGGINYGDPTLNIDWKIPQSQQILSNRDKALPFL